MRFVQLPREQAAHLKSQMMRHLAFYDQLIERMRVRGLHIDEPESYEAVVKISHNLKTAIAPLRESLATRAGTPE